MLIRQGYEEVVRLTIFSCLLYEGVNAAFPVAALRGHGGDVVPAHEPDDVHHGLRLIGVWGHHAREEVVASVVTQLGSRGGVAHLGNLQKQDRARVSKRKQERHARQLTQTIHSDLALPWVGQQ